MSRSDARQPNIRVLCVDNDRDVAEVVQAILVDEGYVVSCLYELADDALSRTVGRLEPDCILLDGVNGMEYGSWDTAAWLDRRARPIPVVMFTAHHLDAIEAREGASRRARAADFAAILEKPFQIDELLDAVATAVARGTPFDRSPPADQARTDSLVAALRGRGAADIKPSSQRESATFRDAAAAIWQIYWWQTRGVYQLGHYEPDGRLQMAGQFTELEAALDLALPG